MKGQKGFSEWQVSSKRTGNTLLQQEAAWRAQGGKLNRRQRQYYSERLKNDALAEGDEWVDDHILNN